MATSEARSPRLATPDEVESLVGLFCSCHQEIGLREHVCAPDRRQDLLKWFNSKIDEGAVWTTDGVSSLAVTTHYKTGTGRLLYLAVAPRERRAGTALKLVERILLEAGSGKVCAEPRNESSRLLLLKAGFLPTNEKMGDDQIFLWPGKQKR
jgi:hypothetical protein